MTLIRVFYIYPDQKFMLLDDIKFVAKKINNIYIFLHVADVSQNSGHTFRPKVSRTCGDFCVPLRFLVEGGARGCEQSITSGFALELPSTHALIAYTRSDIRYRPATKGPG